MLSPQYHLMALFMLPIGSASGSSLGLHLASRRWGRGLTIEVHLLDGNHATVVFLSDIGTFKDHCEMFVGLGRTHIHRVHIAFLAIEGLFADPTVVSLAQLFPSLAVIRREDPAGPVDLRTIHLTEPVVHLDPSKDERFRKLDRDPFTLVLAVDVGVADMLSTVVGALSRMVAVTMFFENLMVEALPGRVVGIVPCA